MWTTASIWPTLTQTDASDFVAKSVDDERRDRKASSDWTNLLSVRLQDRLKCGKVSIVSITPSHLF
ncbi:hypothetical protein Hanom_Chr05g00405151 [Helianthus anomalus]